MVPFNQVCYVCKAMLDSPLSPEVAFRGKPHHKTLDEFWKAIEQGCYFCTTMWKGFTAEQRDAWRDAWRDTKWLGIFMEFEKSQDQSDPNLLTLCISYEDPISQRQSYSQFYIFLHDCKSGTLKAHVNTNLLKALR